jgi:hypothetical protein
MGKTVLENTSNQVNINSLMSETGTRGGRRILTHKGAKGKLHARISQRSMRKGKAHLPTDITSRVE